MLSSFLQQFCELLSGIPIIGGLQAEVCGQIVAFLSSIGL